MFDAQNTISAGNEARFFADTDQLSKVADVDAPRMADFTIGALALLLGWRYISKSKK